MIVDLSRYRDTKIKQRIQAIGIEVEGGWDALPKGVSDLQHDGSVMFGVRRGASGRRDDLRSVSGEVVPALVGELASRPMTHNEWEAWCRKVWPSHINDTCGLHVHMSLTPFRYQLLMDQDYVDTILDTISQWASASGVPADSPLWPRLQGQNEYCTRNFWPDLQANTRAKDYDRRRKGNRYTAVNYCYALHSTVEIRVLPMFPVDQGVSALKAILWATNAFLLSRKRQDSVISSEIDLDSLPAQVEDRVEVVM